MTATRYLLLLAASLTLVSCGKRPQLPPLKDGQSLRQDCIGLMQQFSEGPIPKGDWPASVKSLKPIAVTRERDHVRILLKQERGKFAGGYEVFENTQLSPPTQGVWVQKTQFKGIYQYRTWY